MRVIPYNKQSEMPEYGSYSYQDIYKGACPMSYVDEVYDRVVRENPSQPEFHQAVREVVL